MPPRRGAPPASDCRRCSAAGVTRPRAADRWGLHAGEGLVPSSRPRAYRLGTADGWSRQRFRPRRPWSPPGGCGVACRFPSPAVTIAFSFRPPSGRTKKHPGVAPSAPPPPAPCCPFARPGRGRGRSATGRLGEADAQHGGGTPTGTHRPCRWQRAPAARPRGAVAGAGNAAVPAAACRERAVDGRARGSSWKAHETSSRRPRHGRKRRLPLWQPRSRV